MLQRRGCPHCSAAGSDEGRQSHILWTCPHVKPLWTELWTWWRDEGAFPAADTPDHSSFLRAIFSLNLPSTPLAVWKTPSLIRLAKTDYRAITEVFPTCQVIWQQQVLTTISVIVQWRTGGAETARAWSATSAQAIHSATIRGSLRQLQHSLASSKQSWHSGPRLITDLLAPADRSLVSIKDRLERASTGKYLLFFDGGSRGNPGPGGTGAVIVATDTTHARAAVVWSASMSYANPLTTNNLAEYWGVVTGLRAAKQRHFQPLEVIGDSALILRQLSKSRPPCNDKLLPLYAIACRLADQLGIEQWHHHLRAFNKMADHAANIAMDLSSSFQVLHPMQREEHLRLHALLSGDFQHWQEAASTRLEPTW